jgi:ribosomal protein L24
MIWNAEKNQPDRVGFGKNKDGKKIRIFRSSGNEIDL